MNIENILKEHKKNVTPERIQLFESMDAKHIFSASDIEGEFPNFSRASIFRTLKLFLELGVVRRLPLGENGDMYEVEHEHHHHEHMKCQSCGDILSFESDGICKKIFEAAKKQGFRISEHSLGIFGTCKKCIS
ncbi:transcriptional repressor [Candidatus Gracilibacteria bacterium]|nr:transcriptional repressor [Candidatus Gracilibacteria bacterium]